MGPRSFDRGKQDKTIEQYISGQASMGPRSFDRGKLVGAMLYKQINGLQWGRGLSTAERGPDAREDPRRAVASMGPRSFDRGKPAAAANGINGPSRLQWGR